MKVAPKAAAAKAIAKKEESSEEEDSEEEESEEEAKVRNFLLPAPSGEGVFNYLTVGRYLFI